MIFKVWRGGVLRAATIQLEERFTNREKMPAESIGSAVRPISVLIGVT
jgi:hypothetical protein